MLKDFVVLSELGERIWHAEDIVHAAEQHVDAFPDEEIITITERNDSILTYPLNETFRVNVYSSPLGPVSIWADHWECPICNHLFMPKEDGGAFDVICPLHNPLYCTGRTCGSEHVRIPCRPVGEVFLYDIQARERTIIGRI